MIPAIIGGVQALFGLISEAIPDPDKRAEIAGKLSELEHQARMAQVEVNKVEAQHASLFVAGWRPALGWVCVAGLAYQFLAYPVLTWAAFVFGWSAVPPELDTGLIWALVSGMLGLGGIRGYEKARGAARNRMGPPPTRPVSLGDHGNAQKWTNPDV